MTTEENITEALILEASAAKLLLQSEALMQQARELRAESMNLRKLALQLRPTKHAAG